MVLASLGASLVGGGMQAIGAGQKKDAMGNVLGKMNQATQQRNQANQANIGFTGEGLGQLADQSMGGMSQYLQGQQTVQDMRPELNQQSSQALADARQQVLDSVPETPNFQGGGAGGAWQGQTQHRLSQLGAPATDLRQAQLTEAMTKPLEAQNFSSYQDLLTSLSTRAGSLSRDDQLRAAQIAGKFGVDMAQLQLDMQHAQSAGGALGSFGALLGGVGAGIGGLGVSPATSTPGGMGALGGDAPFLQGGQIPLMSAQNVPLAQYHTFVNWPFTF